jgi:hypothetical protein
VLAGLIAATLACRPRRDTEPKPSPKQGQGEAKAAEAKVNAKADLRPMPRRVQRSPGGADNLERLNERCAAWKRP